MWVIVVVDIRDDDIKNIKEAWNQDGEEGKAGEHGQQSQPSDKQQEPLKENKSYCWDNNGNKSKSEEKSNRQCSHDAEHQHCQS